MAAAVNWESCLGVLMKNARLFGSVVGPPMLYMVIRYEARARSGPYQHAVESAET